MKYAIEISKNTWYIEIISSYKYSSVYLQCNYALCFQACYRHVVTDGMRGKSFRFIHEIRIIIINVKLIPFLKVTWLNLLRRKQFINWSPFTDLEKYLKKDWNLIKYRFIEIDLFNFGSTLTIWSPTYLLLLYLQRVIVLSFYSIDPPYSIDYHRRVVMAGWVTNNAYQELQIVEGFPKSTMTAATSRCEPYFMIPRK